MFGNNYYLANIILYIRFKTKINIMVLYMFTGKISKYVKLIF